ncbi:NUDIX domain-containing protein [Streptomyces werraensis]|uniref:NUDIX domain-containing protein n=1 Tax=Streptomyces werraensis TaxID=68284 RepID=UPI0034359607
MTTARLLALAPALHMAATPPPLLGPLPRTSPANAVVLHDGHVLLQRANWDGQDCYFLPGGGQHPGEPLDQTARHEVHEETGLRVTVERMLWLREYIGANHEHADTEAGTHRIETFFHSPPKAIPAGLADTPKTTRRPAWSGWSWRSCPA